MTLAQQHINTSHSAQNFRYPAVNIQTEKMDTKVCLLVFLIGVVAAQDSKAVTKAKCEIKKNSGKAAIEGEVKFTVVSGGMRVELDLKGFTGAKGAKHGFHVHEKGNTSLQCLGAGGHYNPTGKNHSSRTSPDRHVGDLGNIEEMEGGVIKTMFTDTVIMLSGQYSILGRGIVVHQGEDDLGKGNDQGSVKSGNAGPRMGCCVIEADDDSDGQTGDADHVTRSMHIIVISALLAYFF